MGCEARVGENRWDRAASPDRDASRSLAMWKLGQTKMRSAEEKRDGGWRADGKRRRRAEEGAEGKGSENLLAGV